jgi:hypothetical protein
MNLLILFGIERNCLRNGKSRSLYSSVIRTIKQIVVIKEAYNFCQLPYIQNFVLHPAVKFNSTCTGNYWGSSTLISTQQINYWSYILHPSNTWEKWELNEAVYELFIDFKKAHASITRGVLYNIRIDFGIRMELIRLTKMCMSETYNGAR